MAKRDEPEGSGFLPGLLLGGALGVALGLYLAPRPGREMRALTMDAAGELRDRLAEWLEEVRGVLGAAQGPGLR